MSIATRIEAIEQHLTDDYSVLELAGADLTNVDKNIENLKQSWEERLLYFLANGTDVVWNNWLPKVTGTGESITLNNTIEAKMEFVYKGNTYQYSTTGKNLFDVNSVTSVTNGTISDEIITTNETSNSTYSVFPYFSNISLPANTYYLSMDIRIKSGIGYFNKINDAANDWAVVSKPSLSTTFQRYVASHTYTSVTTLNHILIQFISSTNAVYEIKNIMISTSSDTTYEPYTNGASPNPDYPQDIQVVSGDNTIKVEGKNLLNDYDLINRYKIASIEGNLLTSNAISSNYDTFQPMTKSQKISLIENSDYYVSFDCRLKSGTYGGRIGRATIINTSGQALTINDTPILNPKMSSNFQRMCFKSTANTSTSERIAIMLQVQENLNSAIFEIKNIMISTSNETTYISYETPQTYPINIGNIELCKIGDYQDKIAKSTGKNLFDYKTPNINQITWTPTDNGGKFTSSTHWKNLGNKLELDTTKQYTFSFGARNSDKLYYYIKTYTDETYQTVKTTIVNDGTALSKTFTPDSKYVSIYFANGAVFNNVEIPNIQLEESSTKTEFEPYLPKGTWYLNKQIGKVVLDGSESWVHEAGSQTPTPRTVVTINSINFLNDNYYSNYFILNSTTSNRIVLRTVDSQLYLSLENELAGIINSDTNQQKVDKIKSWLSTHNPIVYYVLATPTNEEITDTTLISQLEATKKSYNNQTNISQTNADKPFILDVTALGN